MTWKDITVRQYYEILEAIKLEDPLERQAALIKAVFGLEMGDIPISELGDYLNQLSFLKEELPKDRFKKEYCIKGITFKPVVDFTKITTAQYIDFQELLKIEDWKNLLGCLLIKDGEIYGESDNTELLWNNLTAPEYGGLLTFFMVWLTKSFQDTLTSSEKELKKLYRRERDPLKKTEILKKIAQMRLARSQSSEVE